MEEREVVTSFLQHRGKILILRRSSKVGTYRGRWAGISGYIEKGDQPLTRAIKEIKEEVGLSQDAVRLIRQGEPVRVSDSEKNILWIVYPFLFETKTETIKINWENLEYKWIVPSDLAKCKTVPKLKEAFDQVKGA